MWIVGWFATQITAYEVKLFGHAIGDPAGQQTWEALALLIGLRLYKQWWQSSRSVLEVRADNVTALAMVTLMKSKGPGVNLVERELALDLADGCYRPDITQHIPGITNGCSDTLSRRFQPGNTFILPKVLAKIAESKIPLRETNTIERSPLLQAAEQTRRRGPEVVLTCSHFNKWSMFLNCLFLQLSMFPNDRGAQWHWGVESFGTSMICIWTIWPLMIC